MSRLLKGTIFYFFPSIFQTLDNSLTVVGEISNTSKYSFTNYMHQLFDIKKRKIDEQDNLVVVNVEI